MCPGPAKGKKAAQEQASSRTKGKKSPEAAGASQLATADDEYANYGGCYMNPYQPWVPPDAMGFFPFGFGYWPQPQYYGQFDQSVPQDWGSHCAPSGADSDVWRLWRDEKGCWTVQEMFDGATNDEERMNLSAVLRGRVWEALKCPHANHVVQKCITVVRPVDNQFIIDELRTGTAGGVAQAARHRYGCRVILRLLEHCPMSQLTPMVHDLLNEAAALSSHIYGHYVMQHILEFCSAEIVSHFTSILEQKVPEIATNDYAGAVIGKALGQPGNAGRDRLAQVVLSDPEQVAAMACSRRGHLAVKEALQLTEGPARHQACEELSSRNERLRESRYGRAVACFVTTLQKPPAVSAE